MPADHKPTPEGETKAWKERLFTIIFKSDTPLGKLFDLTLLVAILLSVIIILFDSVPFIQKDYHRSLYSLEWFFTILFTIEYILRIIIVRNKKKYIFSLMGIIDFMSIIPVYLGIFFVDYQFLMVFRSLRLLRVFRVLQLSSFLRDSRYIIRALYNSYRKILLFMMFISLMALIIGSVMHIIEKDTPGFESIPHGIYWAVVTITTVGYGDITPVTSFGKFLAMVVMLCGYSIIAVPTGIVSAELTKSREEKMPFKKTCLGCGYQKHDNSAQFCKICGDTLYIEKDDE